MLMPIKSYKKNLRKGENAVQSIFRFPTLFPNAFFLRISKMLNCAVNDKT